MNEKPKNNIYKIEIVVEIEPESSILEITEEIGDTLITYWTTEDKMRIGVNRLENWPLEQGEN